MAPPRLYAHRGAAAERPENTLDSFRLALQVGADALEMDVHGTRDGVVVVSHDPDGARMCGVACEFRKVHWVDVEGWDAGWGFVTASNERPFAGKGLRVPRLEHVLDAFPDVPLNIDVKQWDPPIVDRVMELIRARRAEDRVTLASFRLRTLLHARAAGYRGLTALPPTEMVALLALPRLVYGNLPYTGTAAQIPLKAGRVHLDTARVIARCHALGLRVDYWTVNDPAEAERLIALGADGIMTDDPRAIAPVVNRLRASR